MKIKMKRISIILCLLISVSIAFVEGQNGDREPVFMTQTGLIESTNLFHFTEPPVLAGNAPPGPSSSYISTLNYLNINKDRYSILISLIKAAKLDDILSNGQFIVLAPSNQAFNDLPEGSLGEMLTNDKKLTSILQYHIIPGKIDETNFNPTIAYTLGGKSINLADIITQYGNQTIGIVRVSNGNIIPISKVLMPP